MGRRRAGALAPVRVFFGSACQVACHCTNKTLRVPKYCTTLRVPCVDFQVVLDVDVHISLCLDASCLEPHFVQCLIRAIVIIRVVPECANGRILNSGL
eukprot:5584819-Pleurochrysis_carterae.AAC.2